MMYNLGYRVKPNLDLIIDFIKRYTAYFNTMEIKITGEMLHASCMEHIIKQSKQMGIDFLSFHIPKKTFYLENEYNSTYAFLNLVNVFCGNTLVTHFYSDIEYVETYVATICRQSIEKNAKLAVENIEIEIDIFSYLNQMKSFVMQWNLDVCLDIGHLLYSANKCNVNIKDLINYFKNDNWWMEHIIEIHIHDFDNIKCHINIGNGIANFDDVKCLLMCFKPDCTIIIETTIQDLSIQGIKEVKNLKERISGNADN